MIQIGVRAHDFGTLPPDELARGISAYDVSCIQLALAKALKDVPTSPGELGSSGARSIRSAFESRKLSIAILGCYINPVHPDPDAREAALRRFEDHLAYAADFGCRLVGTETGSRNADCSRHPDNSREETYQELAASIKRLARAAEKTKGAIVAVEAVADEHTISSAALMRRLLDDVDSSSVGVIYDPVNLIPHAGVGSQDRFFDECFAAFGDRIVAVHAKDFTMVPGSDGPRKSGPLPAGSGDLDWVGFFRRLRAAGAGDVPVLLENSGPDSVIAAVAKLRAAWDASA